MNIVIDTLVAFLSLGLLGSAFAVLLYVAFTKLSVQTDPRLELILFALPGSNCGACGFAGCQGLAESLLDKKVEVTGCLAGGNETAQKLAEVMGVSLEVQTELVAYVACQAGRNEARAKYEYRGVPNCQAASLYFGGDKACQYGCLGMGSCVEACPFDAIAITDKGIALVNAGKCKSCKKCVAACPRKLIDMVPKNQAVLVSCRNQDRPRKAKEVCTISCTACRICEKNCPEKAIVVQNNLAVINYDICTQCKICVEKCPQKSILFTA
jgi:electron transport complex protein RnfB